MVEFLIPQEKYLEAGVHIGTRTKHGTMRQFIYKAREDGLHVLDLKKMDERVRVAAKVLASYDPRGVFVVGSKDNANVPITKMCELLGFQPVKGRFTPGRFTNPARADFIEPNVVLVTDPGVDRQSVKEAAEINVPVLAFVDTNNSLKNIDLPIPTNNKGRKALALMFWLLTREVLKTRGTLANNEAYTLTPQDFED